MLASDAWEVVAEHWGIALAMAVGSYVAGSTPMGGGTVGFPILVLVFDQSASLGRDFGFAIQSIGMTSASIFILCTGRPLERRLLLWAMLGSLVATPVAVAFFAPHVDERLMKMLFAVVWGSFGIMHFAKIQEICEATGRTRTSAAFDRAAGLLIGVVGGGLVASLTGVAAPVVALGAPLGVYAVDLIGRKPTLLIVSALCLVQFVWMAWSQRDGLGALGVGLSIAGLLAFNLAFHVMSGLGRRLERRRGHTEKLG